MIFFWRQTPVQSKELLSRLAFKVQRYLVASSSSDKFSRPVKRLSLHEAAKCNTNLEIVRILLLNETLLTEANSRGYTPLRSLLEWKS